MGLVVVHHPDYHCELPPGHRFPMAKFRRLQAILLAEGVVKESDVSRPALPAEGVFTGVHTGAYVRAFREGRLDAGAMRKIGLPWSCELVRRTELECAGTLLAARLALRTGLACNTAGGTHHAFPDWGSGFCILNDLAVAADRLLEEGVVKKVLVLDLDVHQGDGTHFIFREEPRVFTFSMHCGKNYPVRKVPGDWDVEVPLGCKDDAYLGVLREVLPELLERSCPELVLYDAGVDTHENDRLGRLAMTTAGLEKRDRLVMEHVRGLGIPLAGVIGGGYNHDIEEVSQRHATLHRVAREFV